ncbi:hypothetical protein PHJA_002827000 [Phtheirospermum japonicum]|uniref:Uncharacterized protein n=1 Tax=Phtheirospermum japonicum TaxID=374723 RepID=A0A830D6C6_9LAMI|nr:hypothetical protein PHJA_002827000 [Phtheirospermum japonicum]
MSCQSCRPYSHEAIILERHVLPILTLLMGLIGATCRANICPSYCVTHIGTTCPPNSTDVILDIKPIDPLLNLFKDVFPAESLLFDFRYLELNSFKHKRGSKRLIPRNRLGIKPERIIPLCQWRLQDTVAAHGVDGEWKWCGLGIDRDLGIELGFLVVVTGVPRCGGLAVVICDSGGGLAVVICDNGGGDL